MRSVSRASRTPNYFSQSIVAGCCNVSACTPNRWHWFDNGIFNLQLDDHVAHRLQDSAIHEAGYFRVPRCADDADGSEQ